MHSDKKSIESSARKVRLLVFSVVVALLLALLVQGAIVSTAPILKLHSTEASGSTLPPPPTPILEYRFEASTPINTGNVGLAANGTLVGSPTFSTDVPPPCTGSSRSLNLNGSSSYVRIPDVFNYTATGTPGPNLDRVTVEAWVKPRTMSGQKIVWDDYGNPGVLLALIDGKVQFNISTLMHPGLGVNNVSGMLVPNYWQHIAGVYDGSRLRVYINGQETCAFVTTSQRIIDQSSLYPGAPAFIGGTAGPALIFDGLIDDLRIFPAALDRTQLAHGCFASVPAIPCCGCL